MEETRYDHHRDLARQTEEILCRYSGFCAQRRVTFSLEETGEEPRILCRLERTDGVAFAQSGDPIDKKLAHLKDQQVVMRLFYLPMGKSPWDEKAANVVSQVDFDYAAIVGYGCREDGTAFVKKLYVLPTDALLAGQKPEEDGSYPKLPLATYYVHQMSLDPRQKFARFLYLVERMTEAMEYQYDTYGYYYSVR
ncbi:MAG: hypothetical protein SOR61_09170 [Evtepia sp.]|uniref:hypothetical protein n=1 Tax=Evtepia sp. TaxID=2773933 RepID=UPI002A75E2EC|nr:hypothetical protein [Evtepia sp.]MDY3015322.1 hypothetical protein [Evtepia sp.]